MRVKIGIAGVLGFGLSVTVALAQGAGQRGARLLAPRTADAEEPAVYARAAAESLPQFPESTPVASPATKHPVQAWLRGNDQQVRPAGGTTQDKSPPRTPPQMGGAPKDEPSFMSKSFDKLKSTFISSPPAAVAPSPNDPTTPTAPFRGTGPAGQPVYAGPPAYRWYGWGSVTPGANPYAPTGQFPRASANWYSITGATPGAFPTQVTDPSKLGTGTEPPMYVTPPTPYTPPNATHNHQPGMHRQPPVMASPVVPRASSVPAHSEPPRTLQAPESFTPPPTLAPLPAVGSAQPTLPVIPVAMPTMTLPADSGATATPQLTPLAVSETEPVGPRVVVTSPLTLAPMLPRAGDNAIPLPPLPTLPALPGVSTSPQAFSPIATHEGKAPAPLPMSVTEEQPKWQPTTATPSRTDWNTAGEKPQTPAASP